MYKLSFFVPKEHKEDVKNALFSLGVGSYEKYDRCSWEIEGDGQFRPLQGADPFVGSINKTEHIKEFKVEMICKDEMIKKAVETLKKAHPYEEVAYEVLKMEDF